MIAHVGDFPCTATEAEHIWIRQEFGHKSELTTNILGLLLEHRHDRLFLNRCMLWLDSRAIMHLGYCARGMDKKLIERHPLQDVRFGRQGGSVFRKGWKNNLNKCMAMLGLHHVAHWSNTQQVVASSSAEAELEACVHEFSECIGAPGLHTIAVCKELQVGR